MSWQEYVDNNLIGSGKVSKAAIIGLSGGVWAFSAGYNLSAEEQHNIVEAFKNSKATQESGIRLIDRKFFTLQADGRSIYGKQGGDGCVLVKTKQAVLVTEYHAPIQAAETTPVVEGLADYLILAGY